MRETLTIVVSLTLMISIGCGRQSPSFDQGWSMPSKITESEDSLGGGVSLYKWQGRIIAFQAQNDGMAKCYLLNPNKGLWTEVSFVGVPQGYLWYRPAFDEKSDRVAFKRDYVENNVLEVNILLGQLTMNGGLAVRDVKEIKWTSNAKALFGETSLDIRLTERPGRRYWPALGTSFLLCGSELSLPFSLSGFTFGEKGTAIARGPDVAGIFSSTNSGATWQLIKTPLGGSSVRTKGQNYLISPKIVLKEGDQLWFSRKSGADGVWDDSKVLTKTYANRHIALAQDDVVHLCWLDKRHQKRKAAFSLFPPGLSREVHNYEVAYCQRKDADSKWSSDVILSKGLQYSFAPTLSVEGERIVVAWAGIQTAESWHTQFRPNDIYYITSKDAGMTWTKPQKITDRAKDGFTSGNPQVVLLNGVIHLAYIQGKMNLKEESPGLVKLNQPPWSIYYQQRPFPK